MNTNLLFLHDCDKNIDIPLPATETIIGRDSFLQCNDKRISRQHGILRPGSDPAGSDPTVQITATHSNPIFIRTGDQVLNILTKDLTATLRPGEKFALLPDQYWFEVRSVGTGAEPSVAADSSEVPQSAAAAEEHQQQDPAPQDEASERVPPQVSSTETTGGFLRIRTMEEVNNAVCSSAFISSSDNSSTVGEKRKLQSEPEISKKHKSSDENSAPIVVAEEPKTPGEASQATDATVAGSSTPAIKTDPDENVASCSHSGKTSGTDAVKVKQEPADSSVSPPRPSCQFGIGCYQRNVQHLAQFAHPSDTDYRRPDLPPAPSTAPHCPFGASCYRRNPQHFREYQHPDASEYKASFRARFQLPTAGGNCVNGSDSEDDCSDRPRRNTRRPAKLEDYVVYK
ncbi:aprataxin and PNK-like factor isoform X3 [Uranotaenia lowii]|uniref:aprataxin and PNK-like factor isoform X3 n=1 Tax=Uranotaenia lowii TaxID=190385 RepID=UPI00247876A6|nr:aprataxin and PNK-like factor isoform X3 [Uranotaenia lowii]